MPAFETCVADRLGAVGEKGENVWTKTQQLRARDDKMGRPENELYFHSRSDLSPDSLP